MPRLILNKLAALCSFDTLCNHAEGLAVGLTIILLTLNFLCSDPLVIFEVHGLHDAEQEHDVEEENDGVEPEEEPIGYDELD
jgi:hypothetical protein